MPLLFKLCTMITKTMQDQVYYYLKGTKYKLVLLRRQKAPLFESRDEWLSGSEFRPSEASVGTDTEKKPRDLSRGVFTGKFWNK
jgi:hypothetical protein